MILFKIFLILLIFSNCKARRYFFILNKYYVRVKGSINCKFNSSDVAYLYITTNPKDAYESHPIFYAQVRSGKSFSLMAKIYRIRKPKLYLRIVHSCVKFNFIDSMRFVVRRYVEEIPPIYIAKNYWNGNFYDRGKIELSRIR